jgi:hypothetical protein
MWWWLRQTGAIPSAHTQSELMDDLQRMAEV